MIKGLVGHSQEVADVFDQDLVGQAVLIDRKGCIYCRARAPEYISAGYVRQIGYLSFLRFLFFRLLVGLVIVRHCHGHDQDVGLAGKVAVNPPSTAPKFWSLIGTASSFNMCTPKTRMAVSTPMSMKLRLGGLSDAEHVHLPL